jgi:hypothetical protein
MVVATDNHGVAAIFSTPYVVHFQNVWIILATNGAIGLVAS